MRRCQLNSDPSALVARLLVYRKSPSNSGTRCLTGHNSMKRHETFRFRSVPCTTRHRNDSNEHSGRDWCGFKYSSLDAGRCRI